MRKLVWWDEFTTEAQDETLASLEEEEEIKDILQQVVEKVYAAAYRDALGDLLPK